MNGYRTIAHESEIEIVIKKSRFIGYAFLVSSAEEANEKLAALRKRQWDASHHCSAYVLGADKQLQKYSDDGEPQGTAGMPILQVLHHKDVTNTMVVVVRYFGGVLLGAGGLVRAYSEAAAKALDAAGLCQYVPVVRWGSCRRLRPLGQAGSFFAIVGYPIGTNGLWGGGSLPRAFPRGSLGVLSPSFV